MPVSSLKRFHPKPAAPVTVDVELLALDLNTCTRCTGSLANLETALALARPVLEAAGIVARVQRRVIATEEEARRHRLLASPTLRINGLDLASDLEESLCDACTDLCGCGEGTRCRVWHYHGEVHEQAPVGLIVEGLLRAAFGSRAAEQPASVVYPGVPDNLRRFFAGTAATTTACCLPDEQDTCCAPEEKNTCCGAEAAPACGCR